MNEEVELKIQSNKLEKESIAHNENNLLVSLLPTLAGGAGSMAAGIQLEEYIVNKTNNQI